MADLVDMAAEQNEAAQRADLQRRKPEGPNPDGKCLYCRSNLPHGLRWCDKSCKEDWDAEQAARRRNGREAND